MTVDAVLRAANWPPQQQAESHLWVRDAESDRRRAPHAAAHDVSTRDAEMAEESTSLPDVVRPCHAFDTAPGSPALAPIERDTHVLPRQAIEDPGPRVNAERGPFVEGRIEPAGREQEQRRTAPVHFVSRGDAVDHRCRHASSRS